MLNKMYFLLIMYQNTEMFLDINASLENKQYNGARYEEYFPRIFPHVSFLFVNFLNIGTYSILALWIIKIIRTGGCQFRQNIFISFQNIRDTF